MILAWVMMAAYVLGNAYIAWGACRYVKAFRVPRFYKIFRIVFPVVYLGCAMAMVVAFVLPEGALRKMLQKFAYYFEGVFLYMLAGFLAAELIVLIFNRRRKLRVKTGGASCRGSHYPIKKRKMYLALLGAVCCGLPVAASVYGFFHASTLYVKEYDVQVDKSGGKLDSMKIVLTADFHLGYSVGSERVSEAVAKINEQNADIVIIAGDLFDNTVDGIDEPARAAELFSQIKSRFGVYGCWGNHDIDERLFSGFTVSEGAGRSAKMEEFVKKAGIRMLADEVVMIGDSFYLAGRKDFSKTGDGTPERKGLGQVLAGVDMAYPVFLIDHQPKGLLENAGAGVDLMLSGHTHGGQIFPLNVLSGLLWENGTGVRCVSGMTSAVTSGVGVYGPDMRIGSDADITVLNVVFS